jgi:hypothetical protein
MHTGATVSDLGILSDDQASTAHALTAAVTDHDLLLTSGGVSTGEEDYVKSAVESVGRLLFWRLAIKPGRPVAMGIIHGVRCSRSTLAIAAGPGHSSTSHCGSGSSALLNTSTSFSSPRPFGNSFSAGDASA